MRWGRILDRGERHRQLQSSRKVIVSRPHWLLLSEALAEWSPLIWVGWLRSRSLVRWSTGRLLCRHKCLADSSSQHNCNKLWAQSQKVGLSLFSATLDRQCLASKKNLMQYRQFQANRLWSKLEQSFQLARFRGQQLWNKLHAVVQLGPTNQCQSGFHLWREELWESRAVASLTIGQLWGVHVGMLQRWAKCSHQSQRLIQSFLGRSYSKGLHESNSLVLHAIWIQ